MFYIYLCLGSTVYIVSGNNIGRIGQITNIESHPGSFDIVHVKDAKGVSFSTRLLIFYFLIINYKN